MIQRNFVNECRCRPQSYLHSSVSTDKLSCEILTLVLNTGGRTVCLFSISRSAILETKLRIGRAKTAIVMVNKCLQLLCIGQSYKYGCQNKIYVSSKMSVWMVGGGWLVRYTYLDFPLDSATKYPRFLVSTMEQILIPF